MSGVSTTYREHAMVIGALRCRDFFLHDIPVLCDLAIGDAEYIDRDQRLWAPSGVPAMNTRSARNSDQHAFEFIVKLAAHLCYLFVTELAEQRRRQVIFEKYLAAAVLIKQHPQRRIKGCGQLMTGHALGRQRVAYFILVGLGPAAFCRQ